MGHMALLADHALTGILANVIAVCAIYTKITVLPFQVGYLFREFPSHVSLRIHIRGKQGMTGGAKG